MTLHTIKIKPLSVNQAWKGRRFKTQAYKDYEQDLLPLLPPISDIPTGKISLQVDIGFSNKSSDIDNPIKPLIDIMQKKYGFNDNKIYKLNITKNIVKKGEEYISISIDGL